MVNGQLGIFLPNTFDVVQPQVLTYRAHPPAPPPTNPGYGHGPPMPRNGHAPSFDGLGQGSEGNAQSSDGHAHGSDGSYVIVRNGEEEEETDKGGEGDDVSNRAQK
jgi:hypothetical protein